MGLLRALSTLFSSLSRLGTPGATIVDMSANPYDFTSAVNQIVTSVKEALAADQKVILMLGEAHPIVADVHLAELVRLGLQNAGIVNPVIAVEQRHNLLEYFLPEFFSNQPFIEKLREALPRLKTDDPYRYHRLQTLTHLAYNWPTTPVTRQESLSNWLANGVDVRLIDIARTKDQKLDYAEPTTAAFIDAHVSTARIDKEAIHGGVREGMALRNLWMKTQLEQALSQSQSGVVILQTGCSHLGGDKRIGVSYSNSLHGLFQNASENVEDKTLRIINVFPENYIFSFRNLLSFEARVAMDRPHTIIVPGGVDAAHDQRRPGSMGTFQEEIAVLQRIAAVSGGSIEVQNPSDYYDRREVYERLLKEESEAIVSKYLGTKPPRDVPSP